MSTTTSNRPIHYMDRDAVSIREFTIEHDGAVEWRSGVAYFEIRDNQLVSLASGTSNAPFYIWNDNGTLMANVEDLLKFFEIAKNPSMDVLREPWEILTHEDRADRVEIIVIDGHSYKDITYALDKALEITVREAESQAQDAKAIRSSSGIISEEYLEIYIKNLRWFYDEVRARQPWDIKTEGGWNKNSMTATYPGHRSVEVNYDGQLISLEKLGNYTYGYIGAALGLPFEMLIGGSVVASNLSNTIRNWIDPRREGDFDNITAELVNEYEDWPFIKMGYDAYR